MLYEWMVEYWKRVDLEPYFVDLDPDVAGQVVDEQVGPLVEAERVVDERVGAVLVDAGLLGAPARVQ